MILHVVTIRDRSADVYGQPSYTTAIGIAIRSFSDEINRADPGNMLHKHPYDFDLYHLGSYDDSTGNIVMNDAGPRMIAIGKDCVK